MKLKGGLFKYQMLSDKERKNLLLLDLIMQKGPISRTDISRETDLNIVTVSNYVNNFLDRGLIIEKGLDVSSGGRKPTLVELNSDGGYVVGIDIGPTNELGIMTDLGARIITRDERERPQRHMEETIKIGADLLESLLVKSNIPRDKIMGVGFGISGVIDSDTGTIRDTDPRRGKTSGSLNAFRLVLEEKFSIPMFMGNDATCAAFGEKRLSLERGVENMLYVYSDVGCGIIIKGDIYCGAGGSAGEIQLSIPEDELSRMNIPVDRFSYLKPLGIDLGIVSRVKAAVKEGIGSKVVELANGTIDNITLDSIIKAAQSGDRLAIDTIEGAAISLGTRIAYLINLFNPEVIVIGGGVEKAGELLLGPIRRTVNKLAFEEPAGRARIIPSALGEDAVALGAASLVLREVFTQL